MKPIIKHPVVVEGKYDKIKLNSLFCANVITTDGFGLFNAKEKTVLIRKLAEKTKVIVLTDSDGAGLVIRNFINGALPKEKIINLYVPEVEGKEKRKKSPSKAGILGVEGIDTDVLQKLFEPYFEGTEERPVPSQLLTKTQFYIDGFSGGAESSKKRKILLKEFGFPSNMSANALIEAINLIGLYGEYKAIAEKIGGEREEDV